MERLWLWGCGFSALSHGGTVGCMGMAVEVFIVLQSIRIVL